MHEPKPFASLSSGLLARKGAARPAMRPQGFGQVGGNLEDLGWNDMGFEPPKVAAGAPRRRRTTRFGEDIVEHPRAVHPTGLTPVGSPVHTQQAEIVRTFKTLRQRRRVEEETAENHVEEAQPETHARTSLPVVAHARCGCACAKACASGPRAAPAARARRLSRCDSTRSVTSSCDSPVRCWRPICPADRHRRAGQVSGCDAGAGYHGHQGQTEGVTAMSKARPLRLGTVADRARFRDRRLRGAAEPRPHRRIRRKGERGDRSRNSRHGRAQLEQHSDRDRVRRAGGRENSERCRIPRSCSEVPISPAVASSRPRRRTRTALSHLFEPAAGRPEARAG